MNHIGSRSLTKTREKLQLGGSMAEQTEQSEAHSESMKKPRDVNATGLMVVGLFKLSKALFFGLVGVEALHLIHTNLGDQMMRLIDWLHINPVGAVASFLMDRVDLIGHHQLREAGTYSLIYAVLCMIEGVGLIRHKVWAEYFTVTLTTAALPWELYELVHRFEWYKVGLILANVAVVLYLLWVLKKKRESEKLAEGF